MDTWDKQEWKQALDDRGSEAEGEAYWRLGKYLFPIALKSLREEDLARELVQQTLVKVFLNYPKFQWKSHIQTYAARILKNEINQFFRNASYKKEVHEPFQEPNDHSEDPDLYHFLVRTQVEHRQVLPEVEIERKEQIQLVSEALKKLSPLQRYALIEYVINEKSAVEVSESLGITINALHKNVSRARRFIREYVKKWALIN